MLLSLSPAEMDGSKSPPSATVDFLFLVFHGGSTLVSQLDKVNKTLDFQTLKSHLSNVTELHYHSAVGRVALRLVPCPSICNSAHKTLCQVRGRRHYRYIMSVLSTLTKLVTTSKLSGCRTCIPFPHEGKGSTKIIVCSIVILHSEELVLFVCL